MSDLKTDLAALRIDQTARAGGGSRKGLWITLVLIVLAVAGAGLYWTMGAQAAPVKTAMVTTVTGGAVAPGAVLNASGYVTARRRATVSSKVTGKVLDEADHRRLVEDAISDLDFSVLEETTT